MCDVKQFEIPKNIMLSLFFVFYLFLHIPIFYFLFLYIYSTLYIHYLLTSKEVQRLEVGQVEGMLLFEYHNNIEKINFLLGEITPSCKSLIHLFDFCTLISSPIISLYIFIYNILYFKKFKKYSLKNYLAESMSHLIISYIMRIFIF